MFAYSVLCASRFYGEKMCDSVCKVAKANRAKLQGLFEQGGLNSVMEQVSSLLSYTT